MNLERFSFKHSLLIAFCGLLETIMYPGWLPRHAIVYIPTAYLGQNLWETQAKAAYLELFPLYVFLFSNSWVYG